MIHTVRRADRPPLEVGARQRLPRARRARGPVARLVPWLVLVVALLPRWLAPAPFLTWDEPTWAYRSLRFTRALQTADLAGTWQSPHPGVVTMWAGAAGITAAGLGEDLAFVDALPDFDEDDVALLRQVLPALGPGRRAIAVLSALLIGGVTALLVGLVGPWTALLAGLLLALDPWLLAHTRVLHLDGLLALLLLASALATLRHLHGDGRRWLLLGGALGGLAMLEKSPGLFGAPFAALLITVVLLAQEGLSLRTWIRIGREGLLWAGAAALAYVALWPALWVDPAGMGGRMFGYALQAAGGAREAVFFAGQVQPDPGILFYGTVLAFRLTPLVVLGLVAGTLLAARELRGGRLTGPVLIVFALLFLLFMGQSAKKFARYVLPAALALDVAAAVGLAGLVAFAADRIGGRAGGAPRSVMEEASLSRRSPTRATMVAGATMAGLLLVQGLWALAGRPHHLATYAPHLGGTAAAARWIPIGWGEGTELAVAWLNAQPGAEEATLATPSMTLVGPGFLGQTLKVRDWREADYVLLYVDDVQIGEPDEVQLFRGVREPLHVVRLRGVDYAWIFAGGES
jgi:4-amino-4-deoxy-L-arabinose transferase-like glycosyltransferase